MDVWRERRVNLVWYKLVRAVQKELFKDLLAK